MSSLRCDILLRHGLLVDGSGAPGTQADLAILDDKIVAMGNLSDWTAGVEYDAASLVICPAFIDVHTHCDLSILHNPCQVSMVYQGIGSVVVGNCGIGGGQVDDSPVFSMEQRWLKPHGVEVDWKGLAGHLKRVEETGIAINYLPLCAHGTLRKRAMEFAQRAPDEGEMLAMKREVADCMEAGAWGFSTGLEYTPGSFAETDELAELTKVAAEGQGYYTSHLKSEGDFLEECVEEAIEICKRAQVPLQLSHHKAEGRKNWGKVNRTLARIEEESANGMDIMADVYPYTAFQTSMMVALLPAWARDGTPEESMRRLIDADARARIIGEMRQADLDYEAASIGSCRTHREWQGKSVAEVARSEQKASEEFVIDFLVEEHGHASVAYFAISEDDVRTVLKHPLVMVGSDAVGYDPFGSMGKERPHPRCYGAFPRVLSTYCREERLLTLEQAVYKMTEMPARRLGLRDRGLLRTGYRADVAIFDAERIQDRSTFTEPHQLSEGIAGLIVNGRWVLRDGELTGARPGAVLRKNG